MDEKSTRQGRPGPEPLSAERELYRQLMAQGMGNSQACREIGINRRTGTRWRYGRIVDTRDGRAAHHYPPITRPRPAVISARYLSAKERNTIADLRRAGRTMTAIAAELGRSAGTISRDLGRNSDPDDGEYRLSPATMHRLTQSRDTQHPCQPQPQCERSSNTRGVPTEPRNRVPPVHRKGATSSPECMPYMGAPHRVCRQSRPTPNQTPCDRRDAVRDAKC